MTAAKVTESRDEDRPRSIDIAGSVLVALTLTPVILALSEGSDWGWTSLATLGCLAVCRRRRVRVRRRGEARRRPDARPGPAAQPGPGRVHDRDPHRRRHHQRADVPGQPLLPGPSDARAQPAAGRPGNAAGHGRTGGRRTLRAAPRGPVRWPPGRRCRVRDHRRRLRVDRLRRRVVEVPGLRPAPRRRRHRHGPLQRSGHLGVDGMRRRGPGRRGLRGLQHGPLRRGGRGDGARRHDLRQRHREQHRRR